MIWAKVASLLASPGRILDFLKSPLGILLVVAAVYAVGHWRGARAEEAEWKAKAQASIEAARQVDAKAAADALAAKDRQLKDAEAREIARKRELDAYVEALSKAGLSGRCSIDDLFPTGPLGGVRGNAVPGRPANSATNR